MRTVNGTGPASAPDSAPATTPGSAPGPNGADPAPPEWVVEVNIGGCRIRRSARRRRHLLGLRAPAPRQLPLRTSGAA